MESRLLNYGMTHADVPTAADENWRLLRLFNYYRLFLAASASLCGLAGAVVPPFGVSSPALFLTSSLIYAALALGAFATLRTRRPDFENQATFLSFADITLLTMLMHASHGIESGLGLLILVAVAGTSLMLGTRLTIFFAALASIAIGLEQNWAVLTGGEWRSDGTRQAGLLGLAMFVTATLSHFLARRLRATEALAARQGVDLANLAQTNALIVERLLAGVIVCDRDGIVHLMNRAAQRFLGVTLQNGSRIALTDLSPPLAERLAAWKVAPGARATGNLLTARTGYTLLPRLTLIGDAASGAVLIFLEDTSLLKKEAQQLKLRSLATLTAGIAHEIRNPLNAIMQSSQLLTESAELSENDQRLAQIIENQCRRMNSSVSNIMQLARRDHVEAQALNLRNWLGDFVNQFCETHKLPRETFAVSITGEGRTVMDPDQLHQVVSNLCQNGLRHSPAFNGRPLIALHVSSNAERRPFLEVLDWGSGVPANIVEHMFDPFVTNTRGGTGLGLYIARELCEANAAQIDYLPREGVGACFRITLARAEDAGMAEAA